MLPWYRQPPPLATVENSRTKIFWDVQHLLSTCPEEGANKPDIVVLDKEKDMAYVIEGTICEIGKTEERTLTKQNKYTDLLYGLAEQVYRPAIRTGKIILPGYDNTNQCSNGLCRWISLKISK